MCDPRNRSALTRNGSLGVRRKFCLIRAFVMAAVGLSKIDTKLGLKWRCDERKAKILLKMNMLDLNLNRLFGFSSNDFFVSMENFVLTYIWWLFQWSGSAGNESSESGVALRDRVPVLDVSTSRNTSRMSGLREWRDRVRPRTVRLSALTRCLTASACDLGRPAMLDFNSFVGNSRP